ncbi:hypothetical protein [Flavobacterium davisii]|uniref:hypothetical protein n=1 Tax=Flavobacterium davisii TaxID=2906077 RepID=UPI0035D03303
MKTLKLRAKDTETYYINVSQITFFYTAIIENKTILRLSCGKEFDVDMTVHEIQEMINQL